MNSLEILSFLCKIPNHTVGVFPADEIPKVWEKPTAFVFNTDNHNKPGTHWVSAYVDKNNEGWYFDSYGLPPLIFNHEKCLRKNCKRYQWNSDKLQSDTSNVCGHYCIMFLNYMSKGYSMPEFLGNFSNDYENNDSIVQDYVACDKSDSKQFIGHGSWKIKNLQQCNAKLSVIA